MKICELCGFIPCVCDSVSSESLLGKPDLGKSLPHPGPDKCEDFVMPFGKHKGKALAQILIDEPAYLDWLLTCDLRDPFRGAVIEMNRKYSVEIQDGVEKRSQDYYRTRSNKFYK